MLKDSLPGMFNSNIYGNLIYELGGRKIMLSGLVMILLCTVSNEVRGWIDEVWGDKLLHLLDAIRIYSTFKVSVQTPLINGLSLIICAWGSVLYLR